MRRTYFLAISSSLISLVSIFFSSLPLYAAGTISISSPKPYQVIQRGEDGKADIQIAGTYTGTTTAIEASWNGGAYVPIALSPSGDSYSGVLEGQDAGQGTLSIRFADDTLVATSTPYVGIGDIFVIAGQSNASGRAFANQTYSHATLKAGLFGNNDQWKNLSDPTDSSAGQKDSVSTDTIAAGSVWPLIATHFLDDQNVPIAFIPTAKGGVSITAWQPNAATSTLYGSMSRRIAAAGGAVKGILFFQGETDAENSMPRTTYLGYLNTFANQAYSDFGVKTVVGQIGNANYATTSLDAIRLAQIDAWDAGAAILPGPSFIDVNLADEGGDNLHFKSVADLQVFSDRWWASLKKDFYAGTDGRGPRLVSAAWGADPAQIVLTFTDETLPLLPQANAAGFSVLDSTGPMQVSSAVRTADNRITLGLANPANGTTTVSYGSKSGVGLSLPTDSSPLHLPAEVFIGRRVEDLTGPFIGSVMLSVSGRSATVTWTTDEASDSRIRYGFSEDNYESFAMDPSLANAHSLTITDLRPGSAYHFKVLSRDALGNEATSSDFTFRTADMPVHRSSGHGGSVRQVAKEPEPDVALPSLPAQEFFRDLSLGMQGEDVRKLQEFLKAQGLFESEVTGYFGPITMEAVVRYQLRGGIEPATGYFGPITQSRMALTVPPGEIGTQGNAPEPAVKFERDLAVGDSGEDVLRLQRFLGDAGYLPQESLTGYFGSLTRAALSEYQRSQNILPSAGYFGPITRQKISNIK